MTVSDVAKYLHISVNTVRRYADSGILKCYRINKKGDRRFESWVVHKYLEDMNQ